MAHGGQHAGAALLGRDVGGDRSDLDAMPLGDLAGRRLGARSGAGPVGPELHQHSEAGSGGQLPLEQVEGGEAVLQGTEVLLSAEAAELLESVGIDEPGLHQLARKGFNTLGLQTYLTAGPKESRAWTIHQGWTAPQAAGVIHTDFEKGFIKAEVISFDDLVATGSVAEARAKGKARLEGKDYVMQDGDVVEFRFNV